MNIMLNQVPVHFIRDGDKILDRDECYINVSDVVSLGRDRVEIYGTNEFGEERRLRMKRDESVYRFVM